MPREHDVSVDAVLDRVGHPADPALLATDPFGEQSRALVRNARQPEDPAVPRARGSVGMLYRDGQA